MIRSRPKTVAVLGVVSLVAGGYILIAGMRLALKSGHVPGISANVRAVAIAAAASLAAAGCAFIIVGYLTIRRPTARAVKYLGVVIGFISWWAIARATEPFLPRPISVAIVDHRGPLQSYEIVAIVVDAASIALAAAIGWSAAKWLRRHAELAGTASSDPRSDVKLSAGG